MMSLELTTDSLVVLVGASGSGKSYWAHTFFRATQIVSSDHCRALVSDDEADQAVNREAFAVFYTIIRQRLRLGRLTVADSTALDAFARTRLLETAAEHGRPVHAVLFLATLEQLLQHNLLRTRFVPEDVLRRHAQQTMELAEAGTLESEGFASVHRLGFPYDLATPPRIRPAAVQEAAAGPPRPLSGPF